MNEVSLTGLNSINVFYTGIATGAGRQRTARILVMNFLKLKCSPMNTKNPQNDKSKIWCGQSIISNYFNYVRSPNKILVKSSTQSKHCFSI